MNCVNLIGRLTSNVEVAYTSKDKVYAKFVLAIPRKSNTEQTDFIKCMAWDKKAKVLEKYTEKGALIGVNGEIRTGNYENSKGDKIYTTEINVEGIKLLQGKNKKDKEL